MGRGMPHAAQPATGLSPARQDRAGFSHLYWQYRKARDISADKHASYIFISLMIGVLFHHIALLWRQEGVLLNGMVAVMLLHVTGECCFSYCISKHVKVYIEHRTWFVMVARMSFQACMLFYVPRTWAYTVPVQLAANKHMAQTYRLLFAYTSSSLLETLAYPLPMQAAVAYHIIRALLYGYACLPRLIHVMTTHEALALTAQRIRVEMTHFYGSAVGLILGADIPGVRDTSVTQVNSGVVVLVVFVHIAYGLAVPLYVLGVMQS